MRVPSLKSEDFNRGSVDALLKNAPQVRLKARILQRSFDAHDGTILHQRGK